MLLPTPTSEEVLRFQSIYKDQYGLDLPVREALPLLTRLVQFYYLTGGHDARRQRQGSAMPTSPKAPQAAEFLGSLTG